MNTNNDLPLDSQENDRVRALPADLHSRREFLKRFGGGIVVFVGFGGKLAEADARFGQRGVPNDFNAFLRIAEDGRVSCLTGKIEMGQGPITSLVQMLADELDAPYEKVDIIMGDTDLCPWDMGTWGSLTTRAFGPLLRAAAAEARGVLLELASETLGVPISRLQAKDGVIFDRKNQKKRVTYGALAKGKPIARHLTVKPELKNVSEFRIMGQPKLRRDALEKVTGKAKYAADIRLPGMLYASILRPPAHGAKLKHIDTSGARKVAGVTVVEDGNFIAVLHELPDVAQEALGRMKAKFDVPRAPVTDENIHEHLIQVAPRGDVAAGGGNLAKGRKLATRTFETTFFDGYVAHAPIETHAALANIEAGKCTVWASTQNPFGARDQIARAIGFPGERVRVITPFVGGGFGGKTGNLQAVEAARLAKAVGRPVQVMRTREEEFFYDTFRPAAIVKIRSGIDDSGRMTLWEYEVLFAGQRGSEHFYNIPHHRTTARPRGWRGGRGTHPFATGAWRAPANNTNTFARESQIDIMATAAGMDPVEFRLKHLGDPRMIRVLRAAAKRFGWTPAKSPSKRGLGVACGIDAGTYVAAIAEVTVDARTGEVEVRRVLCAQEMGIVINPQGATIQMEGCITMGLGYALSEEIHFKGGQILDMNFKHYEIPRFSRLPKIETVILEANDISPQGGGEPTIVVMGAVIANAIHDATGARLRRMPMTPARVKAAMR
ncbi:MAG: molybdopterin-dependent oxidoreductase [Myxococcales bacterium]|nr:molybdopterin-dependent oxidoreductase [Myxococcales bacterium]MDH3842638.1 molybdopterin-dependent oxidoreductase [Myxococcales bacterium]